MTWRDVAVRFPEFVQWVVATNGPLSDEPVTQDEYDRFVAAYYAANEDTA